MTFDQAALQNQYASVLGITTWEYFDKLLSLNVVHHQQTQVNTVLCTAEVKFQLCPETPPTSLGLSSSEMD